MDAHNSHVCVHDKGIMVTAEKNQTNEPIYKKNLKGPSRKKVRTTFSLDDINDAADLISKTK